ncbi:DUF3718 domain-containing protein [Aestuariibacter sp. A3R04]|uniref:DUF3718 domain-containing protein n=1 Tax=Aestuariibacter sp. A3R04 TaxID=2841571 RepID=UPI001C092712|nr:DUF3718 domain-containing protein [Aestuariibacter sp. A3R04]MBU3021653.1 DUF3718 domain-containing protein [Aestuariibacter sp. A3R04]
MKLSTVALALTLSVAATQTFAKSLVLKPLNDNIETQACLTAANEGYQQALRLVRSKGLNSEEFAASVRCNGVTLHTFANMYKTKETPADNTAEARTIALVAKNRDIASQACLEALSSGKEAALAKFGLEGESIICNYKSLNDFVREYSADNVIVRTSAE